jgi:hypothetical protein
LGEGRAIIIPEAELHYFFVLVEFGFAALNFALWPRISTPYGRHFRGGWEWTKEGGVRWVSCPNHLGEIVQWLGFALASWSLAGFAFAIYTGSNLGPQAVEHQRWYRENFKNYPRQRSALIPFVL